MSISTFLCLTNSMELSATWEATSQTNPVHTTKSYL
jgi:hypothetical protein